jgi:hypothetical protein
VRTRGPVTGLGSLRVFYFQGKGVILMGGVRINKILNKILSGRGFIARNVFPTRWQKEPEKMNLSWKGKKILFISVIPVMNG